MDSTKITVKEIKENSKKTTLSADEYFQQIQLAQTLEELGEEPDEFELWCYWKYKEVQIKIKLSENLEDNPDLQSIAKCLVTYAPDLSWVISQQQLIGKQLKKMKDGRESWYNEKHLEAVRAFKEQGNNAPAVKSINAWIEQNYKNEWNEWEDEIDNLYRKEIVLDKHVTIWMKMDKIFSSLIYDLNTEFWRTYKKFNLNDNDRREIPKQILDQYEEESFNQFTKKVSTYEKRS